DLDRTNHLRSDLSGKTTEVGKEAITQIMRPSLVYTELRMHPAYSKALACARDLLGEDMELDFDMLIDKRPYSETETPLHQDAAYWIDMPDKRAVSCWIAIDHATEENGCMWFVSKDQDNKVLDHSAPVAGGALRCEAPIDRAQCIPLKPGDCTFHDGFTLHFSKGNTTKGHRRALILNFRPKDMIDLERSKGVDHLGDRKVRNKIG
ncbi:MAG: phytanoyl-CoA dioxygenase family protein, partial [Bacteroidetes bacterium]|nr:phytanoyl-CoA dioxygenase family protein [Bacteroidota bacterium]